MNIQITRSPQACPDTRTLDIKVDGDSVDIAVTTVVVTNGLAEPHVARSNISMAGIEVSPYPVMIDTHLQLFPRLQVYHPDDDIYIIDAPSWYSDQIPSDPHTRPGGV